MIPGDRISTYFTTRDIATGQAADADSLPTTTIYKNGILETGTNWTLVYPCPVGTYGVSGVIPLSYVLNDSVTIVATASVSGIVDSMNIFETKLEGTDIDLLEDTLLAAIGTGSNPPAVGNGVSLPVSMTFGPFHSVPNLAGSSTAVSGVIVDMYQGTAPAVGAGTFTTSSGITGRTPAITFTPGTSTLTWWVRETWPTGLFDTARATFQYTKTEVFVESK